MNAGGIAIVQHALEFGFVDWTEDGVPRLRLSTDPGTRAVVRPYVATIKAVLERARSFRAQMLVPGAYAFVRYRKGWWSNHRAHPGTCPSCGRQVEAGAFRCSLCEMGVLLALGAPVPAARASGEGR